MQIEAHRPEIPIEEFPIIGFYLYHVTSTGQSSNWTTSGIKQHILTVDLLYPRGGTLIFSHIRRLGPFFWVQNSEFQYFLGFSEK